MSPKPFHIEIGKLYWDMDFQNIIKIAVSISCVVPVFHCSWITDIGFCNYNLSYQYHFSDSTTAQQIAKLR